MKLLGIENNRSEILVNLSQVVVDAMKIYCETIEIKPEDFIKDAIVKDLIQNYVDLQSEKYIYIGDSFSEIKKPLKKFFEGVRLMLEDNSKK